MTILVDWQIETLVKKYNLITPFNREQLNPQSYDVCIGKEIQILDGEKTAYDLEKLGHIIIPSMSFFWVSTIEKCNIPPNVCATFYLKSSMIRNANGLIFCGGGHGDGGWTDSVWTIKLANLESTEIQIDYGQRFGQLVFHRTEMPREDYSKKGNYNHSQGLVTK